MALILIITIFIVRMYLLTNVITMPMQQHFLLPWSEYHFQFFKVVILQLPVQRGSTTPTY